MTHDRVEKSKKEISDVKRTVVTNCVDFPFNPGDSIHWMENEVENKGRVIGILLESSELFNYCNVKIYVVLLDGKVVEVPEKKLPY